MHIIESLHQTHSPDIIVYAPGRVNVIGEHIDYNGGQVLPFAIQQGLHIATKKINDVDKVYTSYSDKPIILSDDAPAWAIYIKDSIAKLRSSYEIDHVELVIEGDLPSGVGLSSSSALVLGIIKAILELHHIFIGENDLIRMASEVEYGAGVKGGLMDQSAIVYGRDGQAVLLNFKNDRIQHIPVDHNLNWFIIHSDIKHDLIHSPYNHKRAICDAALIQAQNLFAIEYLVDLDIHDLADLNLDEEAYRLVRHVIEEQRRVEQMIQAMDHRDVMAMGMVLMESHRSLSENFGVSTPEMDDLVSMINDIDLVHGCRMIGGGFGGAVLGLYEGDLECVFPILDTYNNRYNKEAYAFPVMPSSGLRTLYHKE